MNAFCTLSLSADTDAARYSACLHFLPVSPLPVIFINHACSLALQAIYQSSNMTQALHWLK